MAKCSVPIDAQIYEWRAVISTSLDVHPADLCQSFNLPNYVVSVDSQSLRVLVSGVANHSPNDMSHSQMIQGCLEPVTAIGVVEFHTDR